jgi:hypothetical protein
MLLLVSHKNHNMIIISFLARREKEKEGERLPNPCEGTKSRGLTRRINPIGILINPHPEPIDDLITIIPPDLGHSDEARRSPSTLVLVPAFAQTQT